MSETTSATSTTTMSDEEFVRTVLDLIATQAAAEVESDTRLDSLDLDSLDVVELVHMVKFKLDVTVPAFDVIHADTAGQVASVVLDKR